MIKNTFLALALIASIFLMGCNQQTTDDGVTYKTAPLTIFTQTGQRHAITVEVAQTEEQLAYGLMFREELADDKGMIFIFPDEALRGFWMKNTLIFLDMVFVKSDGTVVKVHSMAQPHDTTMVPSDAPARAVIELRGGLADELGIKAGDHIEFKGF